ncbi:NifU N-terminal domain-containing protein [Terrilactibacillus sp. S3-3]|nr:NifU N-terminal domain-containing protein [Terrilactibacillus sp. S3-3]
MNIRANATPNPNAMKFTADSALFENRIIAKKGQDSDSQLVSQLLSLEGVDNVFGFSDFITVNKTPAASWDDLLPEVETIFDRF